MQRARPSVHHVVWDTHDEVKGLQQGKFASGTTAPVLIKDRISKGDEGSHYA